MWKKILWWVLMAFALLGTLGVLIFSLTVIWGESWLLGM